MLEVMREPKSKRQSDKPFNTKRTKSEMNSFRELVGKVEPIQRKTNYASKFSNQSNFVNAQKFDSWETNKQKFKNQHADINEQSLTLKNKSSGENSNFNHFEELSAMSKLEYRTHSVSIKQMRALKAGKIPICAELDLHGHTRDEALNLVQAILNQNIGLNSVILIIHGKGYNSKTRPTLKSWLNHYLQTQTNIKAFCSATPQDGGTGAVYIWLK